jgi:hypothetical protein
VATQALRFLLMEDMPVIRENVACLGVVEQLGTIGTEFLEF